MSVHPGLMASVGRQPLTFQARPRDQDFILGMDEVWAAVSSSSIRRPVIILQDDRKLTLNESGLAVAGRCQISKAALKL